MTGVFLSLCQYIEKKMHDSDETHQDILNILAAMADFVTFHKGGTTTDCLKRALNEWRMSLRTSSSTERLWLFSSEWNLDPAISAAFCLLLHVLEQAEVYNPALWATHERYRDRLSMFFGDAEVRLSLMSPSNIHAL
jgi:hypothetical protein